MWKLILSGALAISKNPAVRAWAQRQARKLVDRIRNRAEKRIGHILSAAGLEAGPRPKITKLIRVDKDILHPGQVTVVDGKGYRIVRLITSSKTETVYEGVEA